MEVSLERMPANQRRLTNRNAKTLASYYLLRADLQFSEQCLREIGAQSSAAIRRALFNAAAVAYGRCFNSGSQRTRLDHKDVYKLGGDARRFHDSFTRIRNQHIAHSASDFEQCYVTVIPIVAPDGNTLERILTGAVIANVSIPTPDAIQNFTAFITLVLTSIVKPKIEELATQVEADVAGFSLAQIMAFPEVKIAPFNEPHKGRQGLRWETLTEGDIPA